MGIKRSRYAEVLLQPSFSSRHGSRRLHPQVFVRQCRVFKRHEYVWRLGAHGEGIDGVSRIGDEDQGGYSTRRHRPHCRRQNASAMRKCFAPSLCRLTLVTFSLRIDAASSVSGSVIPATFYDHSDGNIVFEHMTKEPTATAPSSMKIKIVAPTNNIILTVGTKRFRVWRRFGGKGGFAVSPGNRWRLPEFFHFSRISQASQLLTSMANRPLAHWSSSIVERYVGDAILNTLSSHGATCPFR